MPENASHHPILGIPNCNFDYIGPQDSQSDGAKQSKWRCKTACFTRRNRLFCTENPCIFKSRTVVLGLQKHTNRWYTISYAKVSKSSKFPRFTSSAKSQTILAAFKWIDQGVLHRQTGFDKMTAKGVEIVCLKDSTLLCHNWWRGTVLQTVVLMHLPPGLCPGLRPLRLV